jgi:hypothetical protein
MYLIPYGFKYININFLYSWDKAACKYLIKESLKLVNKANKLD